MYFCAKISSHCESDFLSSKAQHKISWQKTLFWNYFQEFGEKKNKQNPPHCDPLLAFDLTSSFSLSVTSCWFFKLGSCITLLRKSFLSLQSSSSLLRSRAIVQSSATRFEVLRRDLQENTFLVRNLIIMHRSIRDCFSYTWFKKTWSSFFMKLGLVVPISEISVPNSWSYVMPSLSAFTLSHSKKHSTRFTEPVEQFHPYDRLCQDHQSTFSRKASSSTAEAQRLSIVCWNYSWG